MADETRAELQEAIKAQGEIVRQLKAAKADPAKAPGASINSQLTNLNTNLADTSYISGWSPSTYDKKLYDICLNSMNGEIDKYPHLKRWFKNIKSYDSSERNKFLEVDRPQSKLESIVELLSSGNFEDTGSIDKKSK